MVHTASLLGDTNLGRCTVWSQWSIIDDDTNDCTSVQPIEIGTMVCDVRPPEWEQSNWLPLYTSGRDYWNQWDHMRVPESLANVFVRGSMFTW